MKRKHLISGLWGIYLLFLTVFLLFAGISQLANLIKVIIKLKIFNNTNVIGDPTFYRWRTVFSCLVAASQIAAGCLALRCIVYTPREWQFKALVAVVLITGLFTIVRDGMYHDFKASTFRYCHMSMLLLIFMQTWKLFQTEKENGRKECFPFIRALIRYRKG